MLIKKEIKMITSNEQFKKIVDDRNKYVFIQMGKKLKSGISHKDFRKMYERNRRCMVS